MAVPGNRSLVEAEVAKLQQLQTEISELVERRQTLQVQVNENKSVQEELNLLDDESRVFKLVGPVLLNQDPEEAKQSVIRRLEFIEGEMAKVTKAIEEKERQMEECRKKVMEVQMEMKRQAAEAARQAIEAQ